jgi:hypothetical protein
LALFLLLKWNIFLQSHDLMDVVMVVAEKVAAKKEAAEAMVAEMVVAEKVVAGKAAAEAMDVETAVVEKVVAEKVAAEAMDVETAVVEMAVAEIMDAEMVEDLISIATNVIHVKGAIVEAMTVEMMVVRKMDVEIIAMIGKVATVAVTTVEAAKVVEMVLAVATTSEVTTEARIGVVEMVAEMVAVAVSLVKTVDITVVLLQAEKIILEVKTLGRRKSIRARKHLHPVPDQDHVLQEQTFPDAEALLLVHLSERSDGSSKNSSSFMSIDLAWSLRIRLFASR